MAICAWGVELHMKRCSNRSDPSRLERSTVPFTVEEHLANVQRSAAADDPLFCLLPPLQHKPKGHACASGETVARPVRTQCDLWARDQALHVQPSVLVRRQALQSCPRRGRRYGSQRVRPPKVPRMRLRERRRGDAGWKGISCRGDWGGDRYSDADILAVRTRCPKPSEGTSSRSGRRLHAQVVS